jgi:ferritin-like metal-binding protein YciE
MSEKSSLSIEEKVERVEEIIDRLGNKEIEVSLTEAQDLKNEAKELIEEIEDELALEEGELEEIEVD